MGVVSPRYSLVYNKDVAELFDEFFENYNVKVVQDKVSGNGSKWMRDYIISDDRYTVAIGKDDILRTKVTVYNGYDGKTSVGMTFSAWRQVCKNGMMGWKDIIGEKFSHFSKNILDYLKSTMDKGFAGMSSNFKMFEKWNDIPFTEVQFKGFIDDLEYLSDKQKEATKGLYIPIMNQYNEKATVWGAYNVLTAIATHHTSSRNNLVSNEFSNGYKTITRVTKDFFRNNTTY